MSRKYKVAKFLGVDNHVDEDVEFGTCSLCTFTSSHAYSVVRFLIFDYDPNTGEIKYTSRSQEISIELGGWSWGDYFEYEEFDVLKLALWLDTVYFDTSQQKIGVSLDKLVKLFHGVSDFVGYSSDELDELSRDPERQDDVEYYRECMRDIYYWCDIWDRGSASRE